MFKIVLTQNYYHYTVECKFTNFLSVVSVCVGFVYIYKKFKVV